MADSSNWVEVEKFLEQKEKDALAAEGIILPDDHMAGYKYKPPLKIVKKMPWDVPPMPCAKPTARSHAWSHKDVNFECGAGLAYITLNRPDLNNVFSDSVAAALHDALMELHDRQDIRVVVLRSEGKMFCAGTDPNAFARAAMMTDEQNRKASITFTKLLYYFQSLPQFTIALVQGSAMGIGLGLLACCDMVCSTKAARFAISELKLGHIPAAYAQFVTQKVGITNAMRVLCTGENLTAERCQSMGLLNDVVEEESDFSAIVADVCEKISLCAPQASARAKQLAQYINKQPIDYAAVDWMEKQLDIIGDGYEAKAGMIAVQAKTKPYWADTKIKPLY